MNKTDWPRQYLKLKSRAALKRLEEPFIYHIKKDELYEIDLKTETFLKQCDGTKRGKELTDETEFVEYCIDEDILEALPGPSYEEVKVSIAPYPSLRYLELQLLRKCNLKCKHCYLGQPDNHQLSLEDALKISEEFSTMGGLRLLISGGEPLLYTHLEDFLSKTSHLKIRRVLLTNGTLLNADNISQLNVEEIQFSLDGWEKGHDTLRGDGTFRKTYNGIMAAKDAGIPVSIATMIHNGNLMDFEKMKNFTEEIDAIEWGIDALCLAGYLNENMDLIASNENTAPLLKYANGGGYHGSSEGYACGRHLVTVFPNGDTVKCGFYENSSMGDSRQGLLDCWLKLEHIKLKELDCSGCPVLNDCSGGCRFRADHLHGKDRIMCSLYGME